MWQKQGVIDTIIATLAYIYPPDIYRLSMCYLEGYTKAMPCNNSTIFDVSFLSFNLIWYHLQINLGWHTVR